MHAVLQVQKDAPVGLLLGTDLLPHLGFAFLESGTETSWRNLLQGCPWDKFTEKSNRDSTDTSGSVTTNQASSSQRDVKITITDCEAAEQEVERGKLDQPPPDIVTGDQTPITTGAVRLLQAVRFPAQHKKMLRVRVEGLQGYPLALFEPDPELTKARGLSMPEALVELDENRCITLVLENATLEPTRLKKGRILGYLHPTELILQPSIPEEVSDEITTDNEEGVECSGEMTTTIAYTEESAECCPLEARKQRLMEMLHLNDCSLTAEQHIQLETFLQENEDVFALDSSELGSTDLVKHTINTGDHPPIRQHFRRTPFALRAKVDELVQEMLEQGIIQPSQSPWGSPIVLVRKNDGTTRFCVDYRRLNSVTKLDVFPLPRIDDTLDMLSQSKQFTTLDLASGYWQVRMDPDSHMYGHHCEVFTDHVALKSLLSTPQPSGKLARWGMALQDLDLKIQYRAGKKNSNADALSRYPMHKEESPTMSSCQPFAVVAATSPPKVPTKDGETPLSELQRQDRNLCEIIDYQKTGTLPQDEKRAREMALTKSQYTLLDGVLYRVESDKTLRIIPPESHRKVLWEEVHSGMFGGHLRDAKIHGQLSRHYWWPGIRADILRWCKSCLTCASRHVGRAVRPLLTPIPVAGAFDRLGVDVIQFPPSYNGNKYAVVFVDYLTKWPEVFAVPDQTALTIAQLLVGKIISRHGVPGELLSDRGAAFLSGLMEEVYRLMGIHKVTTTAYHPQTDGLVERFNRTLTDMLAKNSGGEWTELG